MAGKRTRSADQLRRAGGRGAREAGRRAVRLRGRRRRCGRDDARQPGRVRPLADRAADAARQRRARLVAPVLGTAMPAPLLLAPIGVQSIVHPDGELATARAAAELGRADGAVDGLLAHDRGGRRARWATRRAGTSCTGRPTRAGRSASSPRAEAAGLLGARRDARHLAARLAPARPRRRLPAVPAGVGTANSFSDPAFRAGLEKPPEEDLQAAVVHWIPMFRTRRVTLGRPGRCCATHWAARSCSRASSTPTTRAAPSTPAWTASSCPTTAAARSTARSGRSTRCPGIVDAVADELHGAVRLRHPHRRRRVKALALGADAVLLGRPVRLGARAGRRGRRAPRAARLLAELDLTLALSGYRSFDKVGPDALARTHD